MDLCRYDSAHSLVPVGFHNLGFTCYYNSLLQSLLSCTALIQELASNKSNDELLKLFNYLINKFIVLAKYPVPEHIEEIQRLGPLSWRAMIQKLARKSPEFAHFAMGQQCAAEGFSLLLQSIEEHHNIQNLFMYRRRNKLFCPDCKSCFSQVDEMQNIFEVEPQAIVTASKSKNLNEFLLNQHETVDADCVCSKCGVRGEKQKTSTLVMIPEILFVMSKKYKYEEGRGEKLDVYTDFPETLIFNAKKGLELKYEAVAQIEHFGGLNGGHYYAICKRKGGWFCLNDTHVAPAKFEPTNNTYIVLYHVV